MGKLLGRGRFGEVYAGLEECSGLHVAIKVEDAKAAKGRLEHEAGVYEATKGMPGQAQHSCQHSCFHCLHCATRRSSLRWLLLSTGSQR